MVGAVHNTASLPAARLAGGPLARVIDADDIAIRLIVQSHRQSGLSTVYTDLLDFEGHEFHIRPEPSLTGTTYGQALNAYELGIPVGLWHADGTVTMNPAMETVIATGDDLLDDFVEPGSRLDIAALGQDPRDALPRLTNLTVGHTTCDSTNRTQLETLDVGSCKHLIVLSDEDQDPDHADARATPTGRSPKSPKPTTSWSATS
ncbi:hypothetical protein ACFOY4_42020 [Actinomadura syzygii]|uniref:CASTOR/POLLUX-related putative ion channel n=1 Tax=Actinomadura syzygii TaxID=1427538 RepID=UPI001FE656CB|nr:hypothetical protein [Actinomadura syzygii]